jgi:hypothetical protein
LLFSFSFLSFGGSTSVRRLESCQGSVDDETLKKKKRKKVCRWPNRETFCAEYDTHADRRGGTSRDGERGRDRKSEKNKQT